MPSQRCEPAGKCIVKEGDAFLARFRLAIESRPPFEKGAVAVDDGRDAQRGAEPYDFVCTTAAVQVRVCWPSGMVQACVPVSVPPFPLSVPP